MIAEKTCIRSIQQLQRNRLADQFSALVRILQSFDEGAMNRRPMNGKWSATQQVAHLARYHEIFRERLTHILGEDCPRFDRYRAEEDNDWPRWLALSSNEVIERLHLLRVELMEQLERIPADSYTRQGIHPVLGAMRLADWLEFFLVHEGHHMYAIFYDLHGASKK